MLLEADLQRVDPATAVFRLTGRMTLGTRLREIEGRIEDAILTGTRRLILELSGVDFLDSAGLGVIVLLYGKMNSGGGQLRLVAPGPRLLEVFQITKTDAILTIDPSLDDALAAT